MKHKILYGGIGLLGMAGAAAGCGRKVMPVEAAQPTAQSGIVERSDTTDLGPSLIVSYENERVKPKVCRAIEDLGGRKIYDLKNLGMMVYRFGSVRQALDMQERVRHIEGVTGVEIDRKVYLHGGGGGSDGSSVGSFTLDVQ